MYRESRGTYILRVLVRDSTLELHCASPLWREESQQGEMEKIIMRDGKRPLYYEG